MCDLLLLLQYADYRMNDQWTEPRRKNRRPLGFWTAARRRLRYFVVEKRNSGTLIPVIRTQCERGSVIHSDEWPAYSSLTQEGYVQETVNHQHNYVDPDTGAHTQTIELSFMAWRKNFLSWRRREECHYTSYNLIWTITAGTCTTKTNQTSSYHASVTSEQHARNGSILTIFMTRRL